MEVCHTEEQAMMLAGVDEVMYLAEERQSFAAVDCPADCSLRFEELEYNHQLHIEAGCDCYCPIRMDRSHTRGEVERS